MISDIAQRQGFSVDATMSMLDSLMRGNGTMAQFNHPEFSGSGQWMRGGMTMVSDMFNNYLKGRVDSLCSDLSALLSSQPELLRSGSFQSQSQNGGPDAYQEQANFSGGSTSNASFGSASLFVPPVPGSSTDWWPADLRWPNSTGAQNGVRYAYFAQAKRLVIDVGGTVTVYDTLDHQIGGFSQQQSQGGTLGFSSQYGLMDVTRLPVISSNGIAPQGSGLSATSMPAYISPAPNAGRGTVGSQDVFDAIEKLADLKGRGILSEDEFASKKAELLSRL
jgi:hypothetical protein